LWIRARKRKERKNKTKERERGDPWTRRERERGGLLDLMCMDGCD
jgi:hypothetical protein